MSVNLEYHVSSHNKPTLVTLPLPTSLKITYRVSSPSLGTIIHIPNHRGVIVQQKTLYQGAEAVFRCVEVSHCIFWRRYKWVDVTKEVHDMERYCGRSDT